MKLRNIRLYEWMPNIDRTFIPSDEYLKQCIEQFLEKKEYRIRTNNNGLTMPFGGVIQMRPSINLQ